MHVPIGHPVPLSPGAGCAGSHFPGGQKPATNHAVRQSLTRLSPILFAAVCVSRSAPAFASAPVLTFASTPPINDLRLQIVFAVGGRTAHAVFANHIAIPSSYIPLTEIHCVPMGFPHQPILPALTLPLSPPEMVVPRKAGRTCGTTRSGQAPAGFPRATASSIACALTARSTARSRPGRPRAANPVARQDNPACATTPPGRHPSRRVGSRSPSTRPPATCARPPPGKSPAVICRQISSSSPLTGWSDGADRCCWARA